MPGMLARRLIERKRDGGRIATDEWRTLTRAYGCGQVPDAQMAALLMAVYWRGLDPEETLSLTDAMIASGSTLDVSGLKGPRVDKHSTGGVGDKTSLILAPLIASLGVGVPMMSGRGLGHTGGTLDKLEAIPGFRTDLSLGAARRQLEKIGCVLIGQTSEIAPADRRMYALRDATATIDSIPLITASIMSKKLAEGLSGLVLDIKRGSGAFMTALPRALELATSMIALGNNRGCPVVALITAMDRPLGRACGNAIEVEEAIQTLHGEGPPDLTRVTYALGAEMLMLAGIVTSRDDAWRRMEVAVSSGAAATKFQEIIAAQGGDPRVVDDPSRLPQAAECEFYNAPRSGIVAKVEPRIIGSAITALGGGRDQPEDSIDASVGFVVSSKVGDAVKAGEPLATILARDADGVRIARSALDVAIEIADEAEPPLPLISHRVTKEGIEAWDEESR
jgi:pyrimidine-nucleoside phosphorylase